MMENVYKCALHQNCPPKNRRPEGQSKLPIYAFCMGSPLRQLLDRFFPLLYWWVSDSPDNSLVALGARLDPAIAIRFTALGENHPTPWLDSSHRNTDFRLR